MIVKSSNGMYRCDDACCKNFSSYEIVFGGAVGRVSVCDKHFIELMKETNTLLKPLMKNKEKK